MNNLKIYLTHASSGVRITIENWGDRDPRTETEPYEGVKTVFRVADLDQALEKLPQIIEGMRLRGELERPAEASRPKAQPRFRVGEEVQIESFGPSTIKVVFKAVFNDSFAYRISPLDDPDSEWLVLEEEIQ